MTIDYLIQTFQRFNRDYFGGGLPLPRLVLTRAKTRLGSFSCRRKLTWKGYRTSDYTIRISTYYTMTERQVQNVLLHEMIHYSIAYTRLKDTAPHGIVFRGMMDNLNRKYGWEITIRQNTRGWQPAVERKAVERLVLAVQTADGKHFLSVVNPKSRIQLEERLYRLSDIRWHAWYRSTDDFFADFPQVRTLRGRRISADALHHLIQQKCTPLET